MTVRPRTRRAVMRERAIEHRTLAQRPSDVNGAMTFRDLIAAVEEADVTFGGDRIPMRRYVLDHLVPALERHGLMVVRTQDVILNGLAELAASE